MVADGKSRAVAEFSAQFSQAFLGALAGRRIAHTHKAAVAGIIPVADKVVAGLTCTRKRSNCAA